MGIRGNEKMLLVMFLCIAFNLSVYCQEQEYSERNWSIGIFLGYQRNTFIGEISDYFTNVNGFNYGFAFNRKRSTRLCLDLSLSSGSVKYPFISEKGYLIEKGKKTNFTNLGVFIGKIYHQKSINIIPYVGVSVNEFSLSKKDDPKAAYLSQSSFSPLLGIEFEKLIAQKLRIGKYSEVAEKNASFVRLKFFSNYINFNKDVKGVSFSTSILIGIDALPLKLRKYNPNLI